MNKKNIVMIFGDQMRSDSLGVNGCEAAKTPNIDALVNDGVSFRNAYCQNPVCVPSRCSFLTGLYPHTKGHRTMHYMMQREDSNILKELKDNGYHVYWYGRNHLYSSDKPDMIEASCDEYYTGNLEYKSKAFATYDDELSPEDIKKDPYYYSFYEGKIDEEFARNKDSFDWLCFNHALERLDKDELIEPFCLYITVQYPHPPYRCEDPWYSSIDRSLLEERRPNIETLKDKPSMLYKIREKQNLQTWTEDMFRELKGTYYAMCSRLDYQTGLIINKLKEKGLYDNTNIIFGSDHGDYTGDYGIVEKSQNTFENCLSNIPFVIKPANDFEVKPRVSDALVELVDIPATLADMAGIELSYVQFGKSLRGALAGDENHKDAVFCEGGRIHGEDFAKESGHGYRSEYWPRLDTQQSEGPEHTKAIMCRMGNYKYTMRLYEKDEFYNLNEDPKELDNQIDNPKYKEMINEFKLRILDHLFATGDAVPLRREKY